MNQNETICAIATAPGGALGIIRVSGTEAIPCVGKLFKPKGKKPLTERDSHTAVYGSLIEPLSNELIDEVLLTLFRAPHSFTGEDSVEISCHGSNYILRRVMELLIANGCRSARPGEYTQRAFLNGRMDLSQAEAVADVIVSDSAAAHRIAMSQMRGDFSKALANLREQLLHITTLLELELDFSDEHVEFADRAELTRLATHIEETISKLVSSFKTGNSIKNGVPVAIVGPTNAGKSTLLNALLHEERAIVSNVHGTTRDTVEDTISLGGILFRFIDTAGIRETTDTIENLGIERSYQMIDRAEIVLLVTDGSESTLTHEELQQITHRSEGKTLIRIHNKSDLNPTVATDTDTLCLSAKLGDGVEALEQRLVDTIAGTYNPNELIITNARHVEALTLSLQSIRRVIEGLAPELNLPGDLLSQDLRDCIFHLAEIVGGQITSDEVLGNVFKHFCIGK